MFGYRIGVRRLLLLVFVLLVALGYASGLDFSVGVRSEAGTRFLSSVGVSLELEPLWLRGGLRFGAPSGVLAEAGVAAFLPVPLVRPYLGAGAAVGLTEQAESGDYRLAVGEVGYAVVYAGLALPERGYRPYLELARYLGEPGFVRYTVGFVMEVF